MLHYVFMYNYTYTPTMKFLKAMNLEKSKGREIQALEGGEVGGNDVTVISKIKWKVLKRMSQFVVGPNAGFRTMWLECIQITLGPLCVLCESSTGALELLCAPECAGAWLN